MTQEPLRDIPDITVDDLKALGLSLKRSMFSMRLIRDPQGVLNDIKNRDVVIWRILLLDVDYEDIPLLINNNIRGLGIVANWRLQIGK